MKILNLSLILLFFFTAFNINLMNSLQVQSKMKQDAITSLVIFARGQAELKRENQVNVLKGQNNTAVNKIEYSNLLKNTESVNLHKISENLKNLTLNHTAPDISANGTIQSKSKLNSNAMVKTNANSKANDNRKNSTYIETKGKKDIKPFAKLQKTNINMAGNSSLDQDEKNRSNQHIEGTKSK